MRDSTDWGVAFGASLTMTGLGPLQAMIDVRYSAGLNVIDAAPEIENISAKNRGYGVTAALLLPLG